MKTIAKVGLVISFLVGLVAFIRFINKFFSQGVRKNPVLESKDQSCEKAPEVLQSEEDSTIYNFPRQLFIDCHRSTKIDDDALNTDLIENRGNVVHVRQYRDRRMERDILSVSFQVPDPIIQQGSVRGSITIPEILRAVKGRFDLDAGKMLDNNYLIYELNQLMEGGCVAMKTLVHGYIRIVWDNDGKEETLITKVPTDTYLTMGFNNASDYVAHLQKLLDQDNSEVKINCFDHGKEFTAEIVDATIEIEVNIPIKNKNYTDGLRESSAVKFLEKIYNEFQIEGRNRTLRYDYFKFYDPEDRSGIDIYCLDQDGSICVTES